MEVVSLSSKPLIPLFLDPLPNKRGPLLRPRRFSVACRATVKQAHNNKHENFYKMLSLSPKSATLEDIKKAYRSMALRYHPDVCHEEDSTRMFVELNAAYETLSNPRLREEYDYELGLRSSKSSGGGGDESWRSRWREQVAELKRRSHGRVTQKEGSWGTRIRAKNIHKEYYN